MTDHSPFWGLPDPETQAEFYQDVPAKRAIAWVIDTLVIALITVVLVPFTAFTALFFMPALFVMVSFVYRVVTLANRSATPGMRLTAIELRNHRGERFGLGLAFLHTLGFTISFAMVLPQVISVILMMTGARAQGLSDLVLGTAAVNRNAGI